MQDPKQTAKTKPIDKRSNEKQEGVVMCLSKFMRKMFERKEKTERKRYYTVMNATEYWARHRHEKRRKRLAFKKARRIYFKNQRGL